MLSQIASQFVSLYPNCPIFYDPIPRTPSQTQKSVRDILERYGALGRSQWRSLSLEVNEQPQTFRGTAIDAT